MSVVVVVGETDCFRVGRNPALSGEKVLECIEFYPDSLAIFCDSVSLSSLTSPIKASDHFFGGGGISMIFGKNF